MLKQLLRSMFGRDEPAQETKAKTTRAVYAPGYFDATDMDAAKGIILHSGGGTTTDERWVRETPYLVDEIGRDFALDDTAIVIDYGCGIGRVSKGLIDKYRCSVVGIDISPRMRELAAEYVGSPRFEAISPQALDERVAGGFRATHAFSCWVLQHCAVPQTDIDRIDAALAPDGGVFVLNTDIRFIPSDAGWIDDGVSIEALLASRFDTVSRRKMSTAATTPAIADSSFMITLRKR